MTTPTETLRFADCELDLRRRELRRSEQLVLLQPTPLRVLLYLAEHRDRTVPRQELLDSIWPDVVVGDESVTRALAEVRRAVGDDGDAQRVILTQKGVGYRFVAELTSERPPAENAASQPTASRRWIAPAAVALLLAGALALALIWPRLSTPLSPIRSLAVLPLENLSGDPEQRYFADGMTDVLITELAKLPGLRVVSRTSVLQYENTETPLPDIAAALEVDGIVEGSVSRDGDRVRITAQLIDARSDRHVWAERYEREMARALEIQGEVARAVARQIELALTPAEAAQVAASRRHDPRAVDATFRAAALFNSGRSGRGSSERAIALLEEATRYDPSFAPAYAELSQVYSWIGASFPELRTRAAETARSCAARALALDPNDGLSRFASALIALFFDWDWPLAESELERSIELGFDRSAAELMIAQVMVITGRRAEGLRLGESAMAAAPLATHLRGVWARLLFMTGDAARAAEEAERVLEVNPEMPGVLQILHDAYSSLGRGEDAAEVGRRMAGAWPERAPQMAEYQRLHRDQGRAGSRAFWQQDTEQRGYLFWAAVNRTTAAEIDAAFALLERAFRERDPDLRWLVTFPGLAPLHADPRFADLARRMNLPLPTD